MCFFKVRHCSYVLNKISFKCPQWLWTKIAWWMFVFKCSRNLWINIIDLGFIVAPMKRNVATCHTTNSKFANGEIWRPDHLKTWIYKLTAAVVWFKTHGLYIVGYIIAEIYTDKLQTLEHLEVSSRRHNVMKVGQWD